MDVTTERIVRQAGVVPYRINKKGRIQVLLVTSRNHDRWVFPKGTIEKNETPAQCALREAGEEAGIFGEIESACLGRYRYDKFGSPREVDIFLMRVDEVHDAWPEDHQRDRDWFTLEEAASQMIDSEMTRIVSHLEGLIFSD